MEISNAILELEKEITFLKNISKEEKLDKLKSLKDKYTRERRNAFQKGVSSYCDPEWAVPATCESWLSSLLLDGDEEVRRVESIIEEMKNVDRKEENNHVIGYLLLFVLTPAIFYFFHWGLGVIMFFVSTAVIGWKNRYD